MYTLIGKLAVNSYLTFHWSGITNVTAGVHYSRVQVWNGLFVCFQVSTEENFELLSELGAALSITETHQGAQLPTYEILGLFSRIMQH